MEFDYFEPRINQGAQLSLRQVGTEKMPVVIVDHVFSNPNELRSYAATRNEFLPPKEGSYYPGLNAPLPGTYGAPLVSAFRDILESVFRIPTTERLSFEGFFGLATLGQDDLKPLQTIPHFDSPNPRRLAFVHYLCDFPFEGTAFYRHKISGFESINSKRVAVYREHVMRELDSNKSSQYVGPGSENYFKIDYVEARYNRLIIYSSTMLHSAVLDRKLLTNNPMSGRLTANSFIEICR